LTIAIRKTRLIRSESPETRAGDRAFASSPRFSLGRAAAARLSDSWAFPPLNELLSMSFPLLSPLALLVAMTAALFPAFSSSAAAAEIPMYIGTYATKPGGSQGIYLSRFNTDTGAISTPALVVTAVEPSFLVQHPTKPFLYAISQAAPMGVSAYDIEAGGQLHLMSHQPSMGNKPTHLAIDRDGRNVLVANYNSGSIACLPIAADGSLKPATGFSQHRGASQGKSADTKGRQEGPHAHSIYVDRTNERVYAADLGLDKVMIYKFNPAAGSLEPAEPPFATVAPGSGSRHLAFSARDEFIYCVNELNNTVTVFANPEGKGTLQQLQTIGTLPADFKGQSNTSEVQVHPNGKFLYVSNRDAAKEDGRDSLAVFNIAADGRLTVNSHTPTQGSHPRYFCFDPTGKFIVCGNMLSDTIIVFRVDAESGKLTPVGPPVPCFSPSAFLFLK
jgi:6-phosphogluconolactonase